MMRFGIVGLLATLAFMLAPLMALAHTVPLKKHSRECFHEDLHKDDTMTVSFQVGERLATQGGNLDIMFWVSPVGDIHKHIDSRLDGV